MPDKFIEKSTYIIAGYDLQKYRDEILPNTTLLFSGEGCEAIHLQVPGEIQFLHNPESNKYLFFGYIYAEFADTDDDMILKLPSFSSRQSKVDATFKEETGLDISDFDTSFQLITLTETTYTIWRNQDLKRISHITYKNQL